MALRDFWRRSEDLLAEVPPIALLEELPPIVLLGEAPLILAPQKISGPSWDSLRRASSGYLGALGNCANWDNWGNWDAGVIGELGKLVRN